MVKRSESSLLMDFAIYDYSRILISAGHIYIYRLLSWIVRRINEEVPYVNRPSQNLC